MAKKIRKKVTKYNLPIVIEPCEEGGYFTRCPVFPGCFVESETIPQAIEYIEDVIRLFIESYKDWGDPLPVAVLDLFALPMRTEVRYYTQPFSHLAI